MDLSKYNSQELRQLKAEIDKELKSRRRQEARQAQKEIKSIAERYGFSRTGLVSGQPQKGGKRAAKYRHPEDADKTWSGRGRKPAWVKEWESAGRSLDDLRI